MRFLESIIQRSFEAVAIECTGEFEVLPVQYIEKRSGNFVEVVESCARQAEKQGIMVLCIHCDADAKTDVDAFQNKIGPAFHAVDNLTNNNICRNLVAVVPVVMTEAWMLADTVLFKSEIGTDKSDVELGIDKFPENYANPKEIIKNAIIIARQVMPRRRRYDLKIKDIYSPIGQKISLDRLFVLPSYQKFRESIKDAFRKMNYLV